MGWVDRPSARVTRLMGMTAGGPAQCRVLPAHSPGLKGPVEVQQNPWCASLRRTVECRGGVGGGEDAV